MDTTTFHHLERERVDRGGYVHMSDMIGGGKAEGAGPLARKDGVGRTNFSLKGVERRSRYCWETLFIPLPSADR